jgi:hypothetical protein
MKSKGEVEKVRSAVEDQVEISSPSSMLANKGSDEGSLNSLGKDTFEHFLTLIQTNIAREGFTLPCFTTMILKNAHSQDVQQILNELQALRNGISDPDKALSVTGAIDEIKTLPGYNFRVTKNNVFSQEKSSEVSIELHNPEVIENSKLALVGNSDDVSDV